MIPLYVPSATETWVSSFVIRPVAVAPAIVAPSAPEIATERDRVLLDRRVADDARY